MTLKPILFNAYMVQAIRDNLKTATRRVVKPRPDADGLVHFAAVGFVDTDARHYKPPYQAGNILYVREAWAKQNERYYYRADYAPHTSTVWTPFDGCGWHPSIHMPREAARIFLRVQDVKVQRLGDITDKEAAEEGFVSRKDFIAAFLKMYPDCAEESWVWVIEFERISKGEAENG